MESGVRWVNSSWKARAARTQCKRTSSKDRTITAMKQRMAKKEEQKKDKIYTPRNVIHTRMKRQKSCTTAVRYGTAVPGRRFESTGKGKSLRASLAMTGSAVSSLIEAVGQASIARYAPRFSSYFYLFQSINQPVNQASKRLIAATGEGETYLAACKATHTQQFRRRFPPPEAHTGRAGRQQNELLCEYKAALPTYSNDQARVYHMIRLVQGMILLVHQEVNARKARRYKSIRLLRTLTCLSAPVSAAYWLDTHVRLQPITIAI